MKTNFKGTMDSYTKIFDLIDKAKDEMYDLGYSICDIPYFVSDKDKIQNERNIHKELEKRLNDTYELLNEITGSDRKYNRFR